MCRRSIGNTKNITQALNKSEIIALNPEPFKTKFYYHNNTRENPEKNHALIPFSWDVISQLGVFFSWAVFSLWFVLIFPFALVMIEHKTVTRF